MKRSRLLVVIIVNVVLFGAIGKFCQAQDGNTSSVMTWETVWQARRDIIAEAMQLKEQEAEKFWPIYGNYAQKMMALDGRTADMISGYIERSVQLSDTDAEAILAELLNIRQDELALMTEYLEKLKQILPIRKVLRFFQIENTLDTFVEMEIVKQVPLAP